MSWRYKKLKNEYGHDQVFDCSQSPKRPVCSDCYLHYNNTGKGLNCSDCREVHNKDHGQSQTTIEFPNKYGFIDHVLVENGEIVRFDNGDPMPVCPQCKCHVMPNKGQGTMCMSCQHEFDIECEHDMHFYGYFD